MDPDPQSPATAAPAARSTLTVRMHGVVPAPPRTRPAVAPLERDDRPTERMEPLFPDADAYPALADALRRRRARDEAQASARGAGAPTRSPAPSSTVEVALETRAIPSWSPPEPRRRRTSMPAFGAPAPRAAATTARVRPLLGDLDEVGARWLMILAAALAIAVTVAVLATRGG
ncbi:MAG: hypothetical protein H6709_15035 [Kofleriaceae bacterium]|nr:hypothetical protein [Kofleriaceae bacterium]